MFSGNAARAADVFTLKMSIPRTLEETPAAAAFARTIDRRSNGRLKVDIYPNGQLAKEQESIEGLTTGVVDITYVVSAFMEILFPRVGVLGLPFMFKDLSSAMRTVDGPIGNEFFSDFETKGIVGLMWAFTGFRQFETNNHPVRTVADMRGLRFRIVGGAINAAMVQALGAIPVTIDISEVYTALTQRTIDAIDSTVDSLVANKLYNVVNDMATTNHVMAFQVLLASKRKVDALPPDLARLLKDEAKAITPAWRGITVKRTADAYQTLKAHGMTITDIDYAAFRKAMDPVYAGAQSRFGADLIQRVSRAAGAGR